MANPPKKKGTAEETATVRDWMKGDRLVNRMPAGAKYDVHVWPEVNTLETEPIEVLTIRADRTERFTLLRHEDFRHLANIAGVEVHEEVKRYARFAAITIYLSKFGRKT